jgi:hypothetical protein
MHQRIQRYLRDRVAAEREPIPAGAFTLYRHPTEDHHFLNFSRFWFRDTKAPLAYMNVPALRTLRG